MSEPDNKGTSNQGDGQAASQQQQNQPPAGVTGVSEAELADLRRKGAEYDRINEVAKDVGYESPGEYVRRMEDRIYEMADKKTPDSSDDDSKKDDQQQDPPPPKQDAPPGLSESDRQLLQSAVTAGFRGDLQAQFVDHRMDQNGLPEDQRHGFQKQELFEVVTKKSALVTEMLKDADYGGNVFSAAAEVLRITKGKQVQQQQQSTASNDGLQNAANSANVQVGGPTPQPSTQTDQDAAAQANANAARVIAPPAKYVMPKD